MSTLIKTFEIVLLQKNGPVVFPIQTETMEKWRVASETRSVLENMHCALVQNNIVKIQPEF